MCQIVEINRSSFYAWQNAAPTRAERATAGAELDGWIRAVHDDDNTCGAPRITAELNDGLPVEDRINHKRVGRGDARERHRRLPAPPPWIVRSNTRRRHSYCGHKSPTTFAPSRPGVDSYKSTAC